MIIRNGSFASCISLLIAALTLGAESTRVLIVVGPSTYPPGTHEVAAGGRLMKHCVESMSNVPDVTAEVVYEWPQEASTLSSFDTVVFIGDTFPPQRLPETETILAQIDTMMARGCGVVCVHYATGPLVKPGQSILGNASSHETRNSTVLIFGNGFKHRQHFAFAQK